MNTKVGNSEFAELLAAARDLRPFIEARADEAERLTHMHDEVVDAMMAAGLYKMLFPKVLGGAELRLAEALEVNEAVAIADGSTGWCLMVGAIELCNAGAYLPDSGVEEMFANGSDMVVAGQGIPNGRARAVDGGYQISGEWRYASGIYHAQYIHTGCVLMDGDKPVMDANGNVELVLCHVPKSDIVMVEDWDTIGLRGTGSYDYSIDDVFVPADMTYQYIDTPVMRGGAMYRIGIVGWTAWGHTSFALGVGRRALDELAELARTKKNVFGLIGEGSSFKEKFALAEAQYRAARAFCYEAWSDLDDAMARDEYPSLEGIAMIRLAMRHIHEVVSQITTFAHRSGGGVTLRPSILQRCYRDLHAGTQHILLSDQIAQDCGTVLLGMAKEGAGWSVLGLQ
jgi:alkylation response protein AidB-like acyl-CoA dehydrogenase